jgi:glycosyltransferase involved in cell wall biosynthesis
MKILHIVPIYFSDSQIKIFHTLGGGERYPFELARFLALHNAKDEVQLMLFGDRDSTYTINGLQINVIKGIKLFPKTNKNFSPLPFSLSFFKKIYWADIIHAYHTKADITLFAAILAKLFKKPLFLTDLGGGARYSLSRLFDVQPLVHTALCISKFDMQAWNITRKKVIFGGVDVNKYPYKKTKDTYVLYIGRILPHKAIDVLIQAMPNDLKLIVAGRPFDREYLAYLKHLAKDKKVKFIEDPEDRQLIDLYKNASCFVLPSTHIDYKGNKQKKTELFGLVVVEAMACGTPVIVSSAGSLPELVEEGYNGYVFTDRDSAELRKKIKKIVTNKTVITQMGKNARKLVEEKYDWRMIAKRVREAYEE